jgi:hypothetical protein
VRARARHSGKDTQAVAPVSVDVDPRRLGIDVGARASAACAAAAIVASSARSWRAVTAASAPVLRYAASSADV